MKLKICGIRTPEMVRACTQADYIGINFVPNSKRKVLRMPENLNQHRFKIVGIFQDASPEFVAINTQKYQLDVVQLHGQESADQIETLKTLISIPVWKALPVDENFELSKLQEYCDKCELILFDSKNPGSGTVISNKTKLLEAILFTKKTGTKVGLAGGINAENIENFKQSFPEAFLLDTASGIETGGDFSTTETKKLIQNFKA